MSTVDKWYRNYWQRLEARGKVQQDLSAPRIHWFWTESFNEVEKVVFERSRYAKRILDFGAGDLKLKNKFLKAGFTGEYHSVDLSREYQHTYATLAEVSGKYDAIFCFEVVEHMTLNEYVDLMDHFEELLNLDGLVALSTPNPLCVIPMWAQDPGHIQQYPLADIIADFRVRGYETEAFRVRLGERPKGSQRIKFAAARTICYVLGVDYAHGSLVMGRKRSTGPQS